MDHAKELRKLANSIGHGWPPSLPRDTNRLRLAADEIERLRAALIAVQDWERMQPIAIPGYPKDDVDRALCEQVVS